MDHYIFAECPNYAAAMEVAGLRGDQVFTEGHMLDHPERCRALTTWDKGDGPRPARRSPAAAPHRQAMSDTFSSLEAPNG